MMTRMKKAEEVATLSRLLGGAKAAFLVDFTGMNVEEVTSLRRSLYPIQSKMRVVKNTLAKQALKDYPEMESHLLEHFTGVNAFVFAYDDVGTTAKKLTEFLEEVNKFVIKTGVMDGKGLDKNQVKRLAELPSKEELQAQFLGTLQAPAAKFLRVLNEVPAGLARLLAVYKKSKKDE